ncbi:hypothetical protein FCULG_00010738 [Fusarium culmorum]|uniref:Uncharacterized protein n=1 Tax=Fusarium culmorum TaxID=5516 RepID=A0A2T4GYY3_FUSCU|nr:hypothetical protein FCULG_00010738 [Fusarium culmorum]
MPSPKVDCSQWTELNDFSSYIRLLGSKTQFKKDSLEVVIGYVLEITFSVSLSLAIVALKQSEKTSQWHRIVKTGLVAFVDSAAYFALSLQLATIALLIRKDYGISTADLGAIEARISQSVAVVSMMPLLYPIALLEPLTKTCPRDNVKHNSRLLLLSTTVALSFYPFLSRCVYAFSVSPIGNGEGSEVSSIDWSTIEDMCFPQKYRHLGETMTYRSLNGLELTASLLVYLFSFWLLAGLPKMHSRLIEKTIVGQGSEAEPSWRERVNRWFSDRPVVAVVPLFVLVGLSVPLLWVIFTLRKVQEEMSGSMGQEYAGNEWGFGQIVSIVLFIPVAVEMAYQWRFGLAYEQ